MAPFSLTDLEAVIASASRAELSALIGDLERMKAKAWAKIMAGAGEIGVRTSQDDELLTIPEVAHRLRVSNYRAYELARHGELKTVRLGKSVRVRPSDLAVYLARQGA